jgi:hypothetical protein
MAGRSRRRPPDAEEEGEERDRQEQHGDGGGAGAVAACVWLRIHTDATFGVERAVARDQRDRADLANGARERHRDAGEDAGEDARQDNPPEYRRLMRAERTRRFLHVRIELVQHGLNRAHDERQRHEEQHEADRRACERDIELHRRPGP